MSVSNPPLVPGQIGKHTCLGSSSSCRKEPNIDFESDCHSQEKAERTYWSTEGQMEVIGKSSGTPSFHDLESNLNKEEEKLALVTWKIPSIAPDNTLPLSFLQNRLHLRVEGDSQEQTPVGCSVT